MKASTFYMLQILYKRLMQKSGEQSEHWRADSDRVTYMALQTDHSRRLPAALRPRPSLGLLKSLKPSQRAPPKHQASKITRMVGLQSVTYFRKLIWVIQLCNRNITLKKKKKISTQSLWTFGLFPLWNLCYEPLDWLCPLCPVSCLQQPCSAPAGSGLRPPLFGQSISYLVFILIHALKSFIYSFFNNRRSLFKAGETEESII